MLKVEPSEAQKRAGNYAKLHVTLHGLPITIENRKGEERSGVGRDGKTWRVKMPAHYGYFKRSEGADGDHVDCYIGPHPKSRYVMVIDQRDADTKRFDEHKCMLGFANKAQALAFYKRGFSDGKGDARVGSYAEMDIDRFKDWLRNEDTTKRIARASGGRVEDFADGGVPAFDPSKPFDAVAAPAFDPNKPFEPADAKPAGVPKEPTWSDRFANAWNKATPGGPLWLLKNAVQGVRSSTDAANDFAAARNSAAVTESGVPAEDEARNRMIRGASDAAMVLTSAPPRGSGLTGGRQMVPAWEQQSSLFRTPPKPTTTPVAEGNRVLADEFGVDLTRGKATRDMAAIRDEDLASRGAYGKATQDRAVSKFDEEWQQVQDAIHGANEQLAGPGRMVHDNPSEAAATVNSELGTRAGLARRMQQEAEATAAAEAEAQRGIVADQGQVVGDTVRGRSLPIENPREAGEIVSQSVREQAAADRSNFKRLYDEFGSLPGQFDASAVKGLGNRVRNALTFHAEPVVIDDALTPAASKAISALDRLSAPSIQNKADPRAVPAPEDIAAVSLKGVDQMRKQLVAFYQAAKSSGNAADMRATGRVISEFDNQIENSIVEGLFSGDPRALQALKDARAAYSNYQKTYKPQGAGDDVGTAMRRIVERNATPEETANLIVGTGKIGNAGLPVRIYGRLEQVLGPDSDAMSAVNQAIWKKASEIRGANGEIDPAKSAQSVLDFLGSSLAQRAFPQEVRAAMRSHAQGVKSLESVIEALPATQRANQIKSEFQKAFSGEELGGTPSAVFKRIVEGTATPEETANGIFKIIGSGNPGHATRAIQAIERIVGRDSETMGAIKQGVWQRLTQAAEGKDQPGYQKMKQAIGEFLNGTGKSVAEHLYTQEERQRMERFSRLLDLLIIPKYARTNSDTAPALASILQNYSNKIVSGFGHAVPYVGPLVAHLFDKATSSVGQARQARRVADSLDDLIVKAPKSRPSPQGARQIFQRAVPGDLRLGQLLSSGTVPARAQDQQQP